MVNESELHVVFDTVNKHYPHELAAAVICVAETCKYFKGVGGVRDVGGCLNAATI